MLNADEYIVVLHFPGLFQVRLVPKILFWNCCTGWAENKPLSFCDNFSKYWKSLLTIIMVANNKQKRERCEADLNKFVKVNYREHINT